MSAAAPPVPRFGGGFSVALAACSAAIFGFSTTFASLAYQAGSNPFTIVFMRTIVFVLVTALILVWQRRLAWYGPQPLLATAWMAVMLALVSLGYQGSVAYIPVSLAALILYSYPLMVGVIAVAAGRDRMTAGKALTLVTAFAGLGLALGPGFSGLDWRGIALAFLAALGMALTITFGGGAMRGRDALLMAVYTNVWMLLAFALVAAAWGGLAAPATSLGMAGAAGVCLTYVVAYISWYVVLARLRPVRLAALFNIEPLVTLFAAWAVLGERLSEAQLAGAALVLASIVAVQFVFPR